MFTHAENLRFGEFTLSPRKRTLFRERTEIKLRDKDFDVLAFLIQSAPKTCSHDEIIEAVWNGTFVEDGSVAKSITNIRKVLSDDTKNPKFIKTVRSKGYLFIGDIKKDSFTENQITHSVNFSPQPDEIFDGVQTQTKENQRFRYVLICIAVLIIFTGVGTYLAKTFVFNNSDTPQILLADYFSAQELDSQKWLAKGKSIKIADGNALITIDETDKGGHLWSSYFDFNPTKPIVISSRLKFSPNKNYGKYNFNGEFFLIPKVFPKEQSGITDFDWVKKVTLAFGVMYYKAEYEAEDQVPTEGFFLIKPGGRPSFKFSQKAGTISKGIEPIWNQWFEQKIIYNPTSGLMELFINGEKQIELNVGQMPPLDENKMQLQITPYGWYTNHSMEIDYIEITQ